MRVIGYTYDADHHCTNCAIIRWPLEILNDGADHEVNPIFDTDEWYANDIYEGRTHATLNCGTCGEEIDEVQC